MTDAIMDAMNGKWVMIDEETKGFDEYAAAMKMPQALIDTIKKEKGMTFEMTKEGDKYKCVTTMSTGKEEITFKLNEEFTENSMGVTVTNLFTVEGNGVKGKHVFEGQESTTKRFLQGDKLIVESAVTKDKGTDKEKTVTMTSAMKKC